jgi:parallel beta-helix repeat protein
MKNNKNKKYVFQAIFALLIAGLFLIPGSASILTEQHKGLIPTFGGGETIYVDDDNTQGPWDGTQLHPFQYIQDGVDHAANGDMVYVFNGMYTENIVISTSIELIGEDRESTVITGDDFGTVVKIIASGVSLSGFSIMHSGNNPNNAGVMIHTANNIIFGNIIEFNNYFGLYVIGSNNLIYHNNILQNSYQAFDVIASSAWDDGYPNGGNYWSDYMGIDDDEDGIGEIPYPTGNSSADRYPLIHPYGSVVNDNTGEIFLTIQGAIDDPNTQNGHVILVKDGLYREHLSIDKSLVLQGENKWNTSVDGNSSGSVITITAYSVNLRGFLVEHSGDDEENAGILVTGENPYIQENIIFANYQGIILTPTAENAVINSNEILYNAWNGISLKPGVSRVYIFDNIIAENYYAGIGISGASNNYIYHNNFTANRYQAYDDGTNVWDHGYPSGGNYWSDYTGIDADGDGIGDTPYAIPGGINIDRYPLMSSYPPQDDMPPSVMIVSPENGLYLRGHRLFTRVFRQHTLILGDITVNVNASDGQSGVAKVEFYLDTINQPEFIDDQPPYSWTWTKGSLLKHKYSIIVVAYDNAGNMNADILDVRRFL